MPTETGIEQRLSHGYKGFYKIIMLALIHGMSIIISGVHLDTSFSGWLYSLLATPL